MHYQVIVLADHEKQTVHVDALDAASAVRTAMAETSTPRHTAELISVIPDLDDRGRSDEP